MAFYNKLGVVSDHIISHLSDARPSLAHTPPLMVGIQGPQGSGKTYITKQLQTTLTSPPYNLRVAVLSIDDLYLPYTGLRALFDLDNPLLKGRGLPGTHDVALGSQILEALERINEPSAKNSPSSSVEIPFFDKSLNEGFGDRAASTSTIQGPIDVVILEGWFVGFFPLDGESQLQNRWAKEWATEVDRLELGYQNIQFQHIVDVNEKLKDYVKLWEKLSVFVQIYPYNERQEDSPYSNIYSWRLEQEHHMKAGNGGIGMTDEQVKTFIDRYIPGYVFFGSGVATGATTSTDGSPWAGRGLRLLISKDRALHSVETF